jgi:RNA polymerase sigma factor (TIGR02999 family)
VDQKSITWENRSHFFGIAANVMRRILVDHAREHQAAKRGGSVIKLPLDEGIHGTSKPEKMDLVALDGALTRLAKMDPERSKLVELRYFAGLTIEETAQVMGISPATVKRSWAVPGHGCAARSVGQARNGSTGVSPGSGSIHYC